MAKEQTRPARGGDPLAAMYFVAAVLMGIAALVIVALMLLPSDFLSSDDGESWTPGSGEVYGAPRTIEAPAPEELHHH
jgi:hypothetical protein